MDENNKSLNNFINDLPEFIKFLFESGINDSVENCRKNPIHLYPYSTPCPSYHGSLNDWRGTKDFIFEDVCKSRIRLAFDRAYPIKSRIPFYDLICVTLANISKGETKKFFINEILRSTESEQIRDHFAEELYKLNRYLSNDGISEEAYPYIDGLDKLKLNGKYFDFCRCFFRITNNSLSDKGAGMMVEITAEEDSYWTGYPTHKAILRLHGIQSITYKPFDDCGRLDVIKLSYPELELNAYGLQREGKIVSATFKSLEVVSFGISQARDPYEDKCGYEVMIENNTGNEINIRLCNVADYHFGKSAYSPIVFPDNSEDFITIPAGQWISLEKEIQANQMSLYDEHIFTGGNHPANLISEVLINGSEYDLTKLKDSSRWESYVGMPQYPYPRAIEHRLNIS